MVQSRMLSASVGQPVFPAGTYDTPLVTDGAKGAPRVQAPCKDLGALEHDVCVPPSCIAPFEIANLGDPSTCVLAPPLPLLPPPQQPLQTLLTYDDE